MQKVKNLLKRHPALFNAAFFIQNFPREIRSFILPLFVANPADYIPTDPFHGDEHWQNLAQLALEKLPVTSVLETGTYRGDTTVFLAAHTKNTVYTCEVVGLYYREDKHRFTNHPNVELIRGSSPVTMRRLADEKKYGTLPFFFLDAHWYDYWPLPDELDVIVKLSKAIIMIDDFQVPGNPQFGYDTYENRTAGTSIENNLAFISKFIDPKRHRILFPNYGQGTTGLRGHIAIFQDLSAELDALMKNPEIASYYKEYVL